MILDSITISPEICKATRHILHWSRETLAQKSKVNTTRISEFERNSGKKLQTFDMDRIVEAFRKSGVSFEKNEREFVIRIGK